MKLDSRAIENRTVEPQFCPCSGGCVVGCTDACMSCKGNCLGICTGCQLSASY